MIGGDARELQRRRAELVGRSAALRAALARAAGPIVQKAATADRVIASVRKHPLVSAVAVGAVAFAGARSLLPWLTRALTLFALLKRI
jgi:hypothetical protein